MNYSYQQYQQEQLGFKPEGKTTASLVLGICSLFAWIIPIIGLPVTISGLVVGIKTLNRSGSGAAVAGIVMSTIGLILSLANAALGAYLGATGQL